MFRHILVPLDGSELAESTLPAAAYLAKTGRAAVTLLHVIEGRAPSEVHGQRHLHTVREAQSYLKTVAERHFDAVNRVSCHVHEAPVSGVARGIADHQTEFDHDLIVMCTHGRSGANTLVFGSIAQKIVSLGTVPVLIVQPRAPHDAERLFETSPMLVPLDGTAAHEASLAVAGQLAEETGGTMHLLMVVPTLRTLPGRWEDATKLLPHSAERMLEMAAEEAVDYLDDKRAALERRGITATVALRRGDPSAVICESALHTAANLLVLATHGKSGLAALWEGSVASRVFSRISVPVLLVPLSADQSEG